jgi:hypothetical protein
MKTRPQYHKTANYGGCYNTFLIVLLECVGRYQRIAKILGLPLVLLTALGCTASHNAFNAFDRDLAKSGNDHVDFPGTCSPDSTSWVVLSERCYKVQQDQCKSATLQTARAIPILRHWYACFVQHWGSAVSVV